MVYISLPDTYYNNRYSVYVGFRQQTGTLDPKKRLEMLPPSLAVALLWCGAPALAWPAPAGTMAGTKTGIDKPRRDDVALMCAELSRMDAAPRATMCARVTGVRQQCPALCPLGDDLAAKVGAATSLSQTAPPATPPPIVEQQEAESKQPEARKPLDITRLPPGFNLADGKAAEKGREGRRGGGGGSLICRPSPDSPL